MKASEALYRDLCVNSSHGVCVIPLQQVMNERSLLLGRSISTKGYLQREGDSFSLYPVLDLAKYGIREGGIEITAPQEYVAELTALNGKYVAVNGYLSESTQWWAELKVTSPPSELPELFNTLPPAPPPPADREDIAK